MIDSLGIPSQAINARKLNHINKGTGIAVGVGRKICMKFQYLDIQNLILETEHIFGLMWMIMVQF